MSYHFYVTNHAEWKAGTNLVDLVKYFDKYKELKYCVCLIPLDVCSAYSIVDYLPVVEDRVILGIYQNGKKLED